MKEQKFDLRTLERSLDQNLITKEEYEKHLEGLKDVADQAEVIMSSAQDGAASDNE